MAVAAGAFVSRRRRVLRIALVATAVVTLSLIVVAAWLLRNPDRFLPHLIAEAQGKLGLQVEVRHISVSLFPLSFQLQDVEVKNPKPFPAGDFLKVPTIKGTLDFGALLHRQVAFRSIELDHPTFDFISDPDGLWNFQNPALLKNPRQKQPRFSMGTIANLRIQHGEFLASALIDPADTPGPVLLEGHDFSAEFQQVDLRSFSATIVGEEHATAVRFGDIHLRDMQSQVRILPEQLTFKNFEAKTYRGETSGDFTFNFAGTDTKFNTNLKESGIGIQYLLGAFTSGPSNMTGMMQANMTLTGTIEYTENPFTNIYGSGNFVITKGSFPSIAANKSAAKMKSFRNSSAAGVPISDFSRATGDMEFEKSSIYSRKIDIDFYGIDVAGAGHVNDASGRLDYHGAVTIDKKQGVFTNLYAKWFKGAHEKNGRLSFPIRLTGTLSKPDLTMVH